MSRRVASPAHCSACGLVVLSGLDSDVCALTATVDPYPADIVAETRAILSGRNTYDAQIRRDGRVELERRHGYMAGGHRRYPVVLAHDCDKPHRDGAPLVGTGVDEADLFTQHDDERVPF